MKYRVKLTEGFLEEKVVYIFIFIIQDKIIINLKS